MNLFGFLNLRNFLHLLYASSGFVQNMEASTGIVAHSRGTSPRYPRHHHEGFKPENFLHFTQKIQTQATPHTPESHHHHHQGHLHQQALSFEDQPPLPPKNKPHASRHSAHAHHHHTSRHRRAKHTSHQAVNSDPQPGQSTLITFPQVMLPASPVQLNNTFTKNAPHADASTQALPTHATRLPHGIQKMYEIEGITEYRLQNGLRILIAPDNASPTTHVNMVYLVGSRHENYGETGTAHVLEHLLFKGTLTVPDATAEFARRGFFNYNGATTADSTSYYASFTPHPDTLRWYIGWLGDAMVNASLIPKDLDTEMAVVRNELEARENDAIVSLIEKMQAASFQWHNYGNPPVGARSDIENVNLVAVRAFYHQHYRPDNAVLILTGKFDRAASLEIIHQKLGSIRCPAHAKPAEHTIEPVQEGERQLVLRRTGGTPFVYVMYRAPAGNSPEALALTFAMNILVDPPVGRLYRGTVLRKLASAVERKRERTLFYRHDGIVMVGLHLDTGMDPDAASKALAEIMESLSSHPFTQTELERARSKWLNKWQSKIDLPNEFSDELSHTSALGDWRLFFLQRDWARQITLTEVMRTARAYFVASNRITGHYIPTPAPLRAPLLPPQNLTAALTNYQGDVMDDTPITTFEPTLHNIDQHTQRNTLNLTHGQVNVALLPKPNRSHRVQANLLIRFGNVSSLVGQQTIMHAIVSLFNSGIATSTLNREAVQNRFDRLQAEVEFDTLNKHEVGVNEEVLVSLGSTRQYFCAALEALIDVIRHAVFEADQVEEFKATAITKVEDNMASPLALIQQELAGHNNPWPSDDIRYAPSFEELRTRIRTLSSTELTLFYNKFYGAGALLFSAVGDFDADQVKHTLQKNLNDWQSGMPYTRLLTPLHEVASRRFEILTPDKANAAYRAELRLNLQDNAPEYPALYLANYLLGASHHSRLWQRVREQEGLSYHVSSTLKLSSFEPRGMWAIEASYTPTNRQRLEDAIQQELIRVKREGFTHDEVTQGITTLMEHRQYYRFEDKDLSLDLIKFLTKDRLFAWEDNMNHQLRNLTVERVNAVVQQVLHVKAFSTAVAGDFRRDATITPTLPTTTNPDGH